MTGSFGSRRDTLWPAPEMGWPVKQLLELGGVERLKEEAVGRRGDGFGRVASADGIDSCLGVGAELRNQFRSAESGHLRIHQDDVGNARFSGRAFRALWLRLPRYGRDIRPW